VKLLEKAIDIINILEEGVGEPQPFPMAGNVAYYSSVDEKETVKGEWGPWVYDSNDEAWTIHGSELVKYKKDPWGRKMFIEELPMWFEEMPEKDDDDNVKGWVTNSFKSPKGKVYKLKVWNDIA
jgi:hypothetical protein